MSATTGIEWTDKTWNPTVGCTQVHAWEASGGYANQRRAGRGKSENAARERIWFSPACKRPVECPLFDHLEPAT